jgi:signal transduction histidine kinase
MDSADKSTVAAMPPDAVRPRWRRGVRLYLLALVAGGLIPLTLFAAFVAYENAQQQLETVKTSILSSTRAMAVAIDDHVHTRRIMLEGLARSPALQAGDLPAFHAEMVTLSRLLGGTVITLVRQDGTRVLFSALPPGAEVPGTSDPDLVRRVFETASTQISDVFTGAIRHEPVAAIGTPVTIGGVVRYSLHLTLNPSDFIRLLRAFVVPDQWPIGIVDRQGRFLARVPDNEKRVGELASQGWRSILARTHEDNWDRSTSLEGAAIYNGQSPARESGFIVGIGVPAELIEAPLRRSLVNLAVGGCLVLGLGVLIAVLVARRLTDDLDALAAAAELVPVGINRAPAVRSGLTEIEQISIALAASAHTVQARTEERDHADRALRATASDLRRLNETLEERIEAEIATRLRTEEALRQAQKMEAIGQLTGGVAHDFNNLLQVVQGNLEALRERTRDEVPGPIGDELRQLADLALRGAQRGASLTHRLLAFSRQQPLSPEIVAPNKLVAGMSELVQRTLGEKIGIETVLAGGVWPIFADANQLENALLNLAVNARDAMPAGGKLTIETANCHLDEAYVAGHGVAAGQYVMISVTDTGTGIRPEFVDKVFEPFFTTKPVGAGSGLGLSQVYGFVRQSNGHVKIYSELGSGTSVKIFLPRVRAEVGAAPAAPEPAPRADAATTVLVVEDDPDVRALSVAMIGRLGYRVLEAGDGAAALELLRARPEVALMFTDVGLPGQQNGRELAAAALEERPGLKVLFTTGYARNAIIHHGRLDPDVALLAKPFSMAALGEKLRDVLRG